MYKIPIGDTTPAEQAMLRKLRFWIAALAVACLVTGVVVGALLTARPAVFAQNELIVARAPEALSASFSEIARRVEPAVVNIDTVAEVTRRAAEEEDEEEESRGHNPLLDMLRQRSRRPPVPRGVGSGFIVDPSGVIITNYHVVEGATRIRVRLQSGDELIGRVVGSDEETDLAVVRVQTNQPLPTVKIGNSDEVKVGDWVLAVGSPFGLAQTVTAGIVSTKDRESRYSSLVRFIQTDAAINRGNSGGPLVNMRGEVIGVNSQIATTTGDYNGIGFALPSNETEHVYRRLLAEGKVQRGYLGVVLDSVKPNFARLYGMAEARGAIVTSIAAGRDEQGPAAQAGIQIGDIIIDFNNQPIANAQDLINKVAATPVGQSVQVGYLRDAGNSGNLERRTASLRVGERPPPPSSRDESPLRRDAEVESEDAPARPRLGITVSELTPQLAADNNLRGVRGLLIRDIAPGSLADDEDLKAPTVNLAPNTVIQRINRTPVATLAEFERVVNSLKPGDAVVLHLAAYDGRRIAERVVQFTYQ